MAKTGEVKVDIKVNAEEIIKDLKSVQREAKKATQAIRELETMYGTEDGRFYVKWNQDENDNCTDIQTTKLSEIPTKYLQRELSKRENSDENNKAEELLDLSIKTGILITDLHENIRVIGKTIALIKKAHELDIPIIVGNSTTQSIILKQVKDLNLNVHCYSGRSIDTTIRGKRFTNNSFLVDDSVTNNMIIEMQKIGFKCIGGFNNLRTSI